MTASLIAPVPEPTAPISDRRLIALHEAAHAVAALDMRLPLTFIRLCEQGGRVLGGYASTNPEPLAPDAEALFLATVEAGRCPAVPRDVLAVMVYTSAGPAADERCGLSRYHARQDYEDNIAVAEAALKRPYFVSMKGYDKKVRGLLDYTHALAQTLVRNRWKWINRTADALEQHGTLTAEQIRKLEVNEGGNAWLFPKHTKRR